LVVRLPERTDRGSLSDVVGGNPPTVAMRVGFLQ
jgi:hypothetical protein